MLNHFISSPLGATEDSSTQRDCSELESLIWDPSNTLTDKQVDQFLVVAR